MNRGLATAEKYGLFDSNLHEGLEEHGFLKPLSSIHGIEHVGWCNMEPVFQLTGEQSITHVGESITELVTSDTMESAGLRGIILPGDSDFTQFNSPTEMWNAVVLLVKVEDWWHSCLPNHLIDNQQEAEQYIESQERKMSTRLKKKLGSYIIGVDMHSSQGGDFGQYQFVGWVR